MHTTWNTLDSGMPRVFSNAALSWCQDITFLNVDFPFNTLEITELQRKIYEYALRGAGDVLFMFIIMVISCAMFSVGLSYVLVVKCRLGLIGYWIALAIDEGVRALVSYLRWQYKMDRRKKNEISNF